MVRTSDGSYAIAGDTQFGSETHKDIFFVKTETLEQPPQTTPTPNPSTPEPTTNPTAIPSSQPTSDPNQTPQNQTPSSSLSPNATSNPDILPISQEQTILIVGAIFGAVIVSGTAIFVRVRRKRSRDTSLVK